MKQYALTLDLKDDPDLIQQYEQHHKEVWPEVLRSIKVAGIEEMAIYRFGTRLFMMMHVKDDFSFEKKAEADSRNTSVQEWESLMWKYQQPLAEAGTGEKWKLMDKIFELK